jgi:hypothetical protein
VGSKNHGNQVTSAKRMRKIEITEEMISAAAEVLSANEGWVFGYGSAQAVATEMLACALESHSEASDKAAQ